MSFGFQITFSAPGICLFLAKFYFLFLRKPTQKKKKKSEGGDFIQLFKPQMVLPLAT